MFTIQFTKMYQVAGDKPREQARGFIINKTKSEIVAFTTFDKAVNYLTNEMGYKPVKNMENQFIGNESTMSGGYEYFYTLYEIKGVEVQ